VAIALILTGVVLLTGGAKPGQTTRGANTLEQGS